MSPSMYPDEITELLFLGGFGLVLCWSLLLWAWEGERIKLYSWLQTTQRKRYGAVLLANGIATMSLFPLYKYGWAQTVGALTEMRHDSSYYGWMVTAIFYGLLTVPVLSLLVTFSIYHRPAFLAKKTGRWYQPTGSYVRTEHVRKRKKPYAGVS